MLTWLISKIVLNPTMLVTILFGVFTFGVTTGGTVTWKIQELRVESAKQSRVEIEQKFIKYQQDEQAEFLRIEEKNREDAIKYQKIFATQSTLLADANKNGETLRRCIESGKCNGMRVKSRVSTASSNSVQTSIRLNANGSDPISVRGISSEESEVVNDCAKTTVMLNLLQNAIEGQDGF